MIGRERIQQCRDAASTARASSRLLRTWVPRILLAVTGSDPATFLPHVRPCRTPKEPTPQTMPTYANPSASPSSAAPPAGEAITVDGRTLRVPNTPIIPYIEGDGTGPDIRSASQKVFDAAVQQSYGGERRIQWLEVLAGEKAKNRLDSWLPDDTLAAIDHYLIAIKGPLTTPVGGGFRSLNVALRQKLDLYACVRPVRYFTGVPSPVKAPELVDMVIFRENTEDIYAGIEYKARSEDARRLIQFLHDQLGATTIRFPESSGIGIKPMSEDGTKRLFARRSTMPSARAKSVTLVHKGNIMKFTEGAFRDWGYGVARAEYGATDFQGGPWVQLPGGIIIKDVIADAFLQQILTRPADYDVIATPNLNGDYISDALAAQVRRHRHRAGREHQLCHWPRGVRGHSRNGPQVRRQGCRQPGIRHPLWRDDASLPRLE